MAPSVASSMATIRPRRFDFTELHATRRGVVGAGNLVRPTDGLAGRSVFRRTRRLRALALGGFGGCSHLFPLICYEKGVHDAADGGLLVLEARRGTTDHQQPYLARSPVDPSRLLVGDLAA